MEMLQDNLFLKGYVEDYQDGIRDGAAGKTAEMIRSDISNLPIKMMGLSTRASNCLKNMGCLYVSDVVKLTEREIMAMRNLGKVTASEIGFWLVSHGIVQSDWSAFL